MVTYRISERDLTTSTFGVSALSETTLSLRAVWRPTVYPHMASWSRAVEPLLAQCDLEALLALVAPDYSTPDFLNPRPDAAVTDFAAELRIVAALPHREVERDLDAIHPNGRPEALAGPTAEVLDRIVRAIDQYWRLCVRPWWSTFHATLSADIAARALNSADRGWRATLSELSPALDLTDRELTAWNPSGPWFTSDARGRGLVFVPTHFTPHASYPFSPDAPPYVLYPAVGRGTLDARRDVPPSLATLIGPGRAELLVSLSGPTSSTTVAARRGITVSAANQQLRWLHSAGMVVPVRRGRSVLYQRTPTARRLIEDLGRSA